MPVTRKQAVDPARVHTLAERPAGPGPVIYWMSRDQRADDNWALLHAQQEALLRKTPLGVLFCLVPGFLSATAPQYAFMLQGLVETSEALASRSIPFFCIEGDPCDTIPSFAARCKASLLVADFDPLRIKVDWRTRIARSATCPCREVDAHNIVPCRFVSQKEEFAARTIRPKITRLLPRFMARLPRLRKHPYPWTCPTRATTPARLAKKIGVSLSTDPAGWEAGPSAARARLRAFVKRGLGDYDFARNDPTLTGQSNLSPYLHFGQLSAQRVALAVETAPVLPEAKAAFLEELIIRRELSDNFCLYNPRYDSAAGFADWAKKTLREHRRDRREYVYSFEQFESGETHDHLWNAAQMEMVKTGKMHGYLRMYWGKKILEWTRTPSAAMEIALSLNNRYELDGRDPNGYAGVAWCIGGIHDRAWPSHPVFGKIRYMNRNGCRRKFDVDAYINRVSRI